MSLSAQAKVLRVLQDNRIQKVGGGKDIKIDVRVIAATNKDLKEISEGKFREDLYHRLAVIIINVSSLDSRKTTFLPVNILRRILLSHRVQGQEIFRKSN